MAFNLAPKDPVSFSAGAPAFRPGIVILAVVFILLVAAGIFAGIKFQDINAGREAQLKDIQSVEIDHQPEQESEMDGIREADRKLAELRDSNRDLEQGLTNEDGFLK